MPDTADLSSIPVAAGLLRRALPLVRDEIALLIDCHCLWVPDENGEPRPYPDTLDDEVVETVAELRELAAGIENFLAGVPA